MSVALAICSDNNLDITLISLNGSGEFDITPLPYLKFSNWDNRHAIFSWNDELYISCIMNRGSEFAIYKIQPDKLLQVCYYRNNTLDTTQVVITDHVSIDMLKHPFSMDGNLAYIGMPNGIVCIDLAMMMLIRVFNCAMPSSICAFDGIVYYTLDGIPAIQPAGYTHITCETKCGIHYISRRERKIIVFSPLYDVVNDVRSAYAIDVPDEYMGVLHAEHMTGSTDVKIRTIGQGPLHFKLDDSCGPDFYEVEIYNDVDGTRYRLAIPLTFQWPVLSSIDHI